MQRIFKSLLFLILLSFTIANFTQAQQQVENPGFEYWEEFEFGPDTLEPVNWSSLKSSDGGELINNVIPVVWERSTDAHSGMYSIKLENMPILTLVAPGTLTNGRVHAALPPTDAYVYTIKEEPQWNTPFTDTPDSLSVWAKFFPQEMDKAHIFAVLHTDTAKIADSTMTNWVAIAHVEIPEEVTDWTKFEVPFTYLNANTPEYILFAIYSGDAQGALAGSIMYLDDIELRYYNVSVNSQETKQAEIYMAEDKLIVKLSSHELDQNTTMEIHDMAGRVILSRQFTSALFNEFRINIPAGVYVCKVKSTSSEYSQKIIKN